MCEYFAHNQQICNLIMNLRQLGGRIRNARKDRGLTLKNLGSETGVDHSQISRIERGESVRLSSNVQKICEFLHISECEEDIVGIRSDAELKIRSLIQEWPQSEQMICDIVDSIQRAWLERDLREQSLGRKSLKKHREVSELIQRSAISSEST